jgi:hypothetical protein
MNNKLKILPILILLIAVAGLAQEMPEGFGKNHGIYDRLERAERFRAFMEHFNNHFDNEKGGEMIEELKPCPFCGGDAEIERPGTSKQSMIIACLDCGCTVESGDVVGFTAVKHYLWNKRVDK